jgi:hypothetical protein
MGATLEVIPTVGVDDEVFLLSGDDGVHFDGDERSSINGRALVVGIDTTDKIGMSQLAIVVEAVVPDNGELEVLGNHLIEALIVIVVLDAEARKGSLKDREVIEEEDITVGTTDIALGDPTDTDVNSLLVTNSGGEHNPSPATERTVDVNIDVLNVELDRAPSAIVDSVVDEALVAVEFPVELEEADINLIDTKSRDRSQLEVGVEVSDNTITTPRGNLVHHGHVHDTLIRGLSIGEDRKIAGEDIVRARIVVLAHLGIDAGEPVPTGEGLVLVVLRDDSTVNLLVGTNHASGIATAFLFEAIRVQGSVLGEDGTVETGMLLLNSGLTGHSGVRRGLGDAHSVVCLGERKGCAQSKTKNH